MIFFSSKHNVNPQNFFFFFLQLHGQHVNKVKTSNTVLPGWQALLEAMPADVIIQKIQCIILWGHQGITIIIFCMGITKKK